MPFLCSCQENNHHTAGPRHTVSTLVGRTIRGRFTKATSPEFKPYPLSAKLPPRHEEALERMNARFQADPTLIRQRRCAAEHPFGTIKRMTAGERFLTRGIRKVSAEAALSVLAYNIIPEINLIGTATLRASLA
ncbi:MAG TPA: transposase [Pseudolabrys sp.]|nr:transposase [Pseudolabrys sp.]